jgi:hypothetical protein
MGDEGCCAAIRNTDPPTIGFQAEVHGNLPRNVDWRDVSQIRATAGPQVGQRLLGEGVQSTAGDIRLKLSVPGVGIVFGEPCSERS